MGADDYVVKPFSPREVVSRVQARVPASKPRARFCSDRPVGRLDHGARAIFRGISERASTHSFKYGTGAPPRDTPSGGGISEG